MDSWILWLKFIFLLNFRGVLEIFMWDLEVDEDFNASFGDGSKFVGPNKELCGYPLLATMFLFQFPFFF